MKTRTSKPPKPLEKKVQKQALAILKREGIIAFRRNVAAMTGEYNGKRRFIRANEPGMSDIWGIIPASLLRLDPPFPTDVSRTIAQRLGHCDWRFGRHFEAEAKRLGERPTLDQVLWLIKMNELTGAAFWFDSIETLVKVMRCLTSGGRVEYLNTTRRYGKTMGPSGDYDIVWDE